MTSSYVSWWTGGLGIVQVLGLLLKFLCHALYSAYSHSAKLYVVLWHLTLRLTDEGFLDFVQRFTEAELFVLFVLTVSRKHMFCHTKTSSSGIPSLYCSSSSVHVELVPMARKTVLCSQTLTDKSTCTALGGGRLFDAAVQLRLPVCISH